MTVIMLNFIFSTLLVYILFIFKLNIFILFWISSFEKRKKNITKERKDILLFLTFEGAFSSLSLSATKPKIRVSRSSSFLTALTVLGFYLPNTTQVHPSLFSLYLSAICVPLLLLLSFFLRCFGYGVFCSFRLFSYLSFKDIVFGSPFCLCYILFEISRRMNFVLTHPLFCSSRLLSLCFCIFVTLSIVFDVFC